MVAAWLTLTAALLTQAGEARVTAELYAEGRYLDTPGSPGRGGGDFEPRLTFEYQRPTSTFQAVYGPSLVLDGSSSELLQVLHQANLTGRFQSSARTSWSTELSGTYGTRDLRLQNATAGTQAPQPLPALAVVRYGSAAATVGAQHALTRSVQLQGTIGFLLQGGLDARSRTATPTQRTPSARASLDYDLTSKDRLSTSFEGSYTSFTAGSSFWAARGLESWRRALAPSASIRFGGGLGAHGGQGQTLVTWAAEAGYEQTIASPAIHIEVTARAAPYVDTTNVTSYQRADAQASISWAAHPTLRMSGMTAAGIVLSGPSKGEVIQSWQLATNWATTQYLQFTMGVRGQFQHVGSNRLATPVNEWTAFVGTTLRYSHLLGR